MASNTALSIENILQKKTDPILMKWTGNNGIEVQKPAEPACVNLAANSISNILEGTDHQDIRSITDKDSIPQEVTPSNEHEATRSSNHVWKIPAAKYSDFLWEN